MIDILVPVLNRPKNVLPLILSIDSTSIHVERIIFLLTGGDLEEYDAVHKEYERWWPVYHYSIDNSPDHQYPRKMNLGAEVSEADWLLLASDDIDFQPGWDTTALALAEATGAGVIGTNDKANGQVIRGQFSTQPLVRRAYIEEYGGTATDGPGVLLHEGYDHNFVERELAGMAMMRGQWAFAKNAIIRHRHPNWRTAPNDSTYEKGLRNFKQDQELFFSRAHHWNYEGLSPAERRRARAAVR